MDEPELPALSAPAQAEIRGHTRPSLLLTRKRTRSDYADEPATSSDPATFSSDETAPGAENYAAGKRKKKHTFRGSWWDLHPAKSGTRTSQRKKREFRRNFDSGIFMGSESEEPLSSDSFTMEDEFLRDQERSSQKDHDSSQHPRVRSCGSQDSTPRTKLALRNAVQVPKEHEAVCHVVRQCLELGKEDVDLSVMSLSTLPSEVSTLNTLSKQEEIAEGMLHIGTDLEPRLRLFLGNNLFTKLPSVVLDLRHLRFLSLRNNNLSSLPPSIRDLFNLESLNIAGNQLTELPSEVLDLVSNARLQELILHPNPWNQPARLPPKRIQPGSHIPLIQNGNLRLWQPISAPDHFEGECPPRLATNSNSPIPSLTELVLRHLAKLDPRGETVDYTEYMPHGSPQTVLDNLSSLKEHPDRRCGSCKRQIVRAAKEEIQWWYVSRDPSGGDSEETTGEVASPPRAIKFRHLLCYDACRGSGVSSEL
ncbi:hypothetical protein A1O7_00752 [Cladophialophora yegresii CBS 114405]|uniref:Glucose-repressible alcohol dehydrogenase transcriptional effector n=1 Tax=Cladophialophora yegresii CBS 114405 TaxID=1182544 RepID=W9WIJ4_9EURO|nr:uncharacterized protein A1O7_00752 [Cladophialophora yegresii CBS 114405]EXJ64416.1 hypothetical protein A1O7_00752 [Cladophialophora yegresii CBS 114405]